MPASDLEIAAAIDADPDNDDLFLTFGDELQSRSDPRGELIMLDRRLMEAPWGEDGRRLRKRRAELLERHANDLVGPLTSSLGAPVRITWHLGFVRKLVLAVNLTDELPPLVEILSHPSTRFLQELEVGGVHPPGDVEAMSAVTRELSLTSLPSLRSLTLGSIAHGGDYPVVTNVSAVLAAAPRLRRLEVVATDDLEMFHCETLRELHLRIDGAGPKHLEMLTTHARLETFSLTLGGATIDPELIAQTVSSAASIENVGLIGSGEADDLAEALVARNIAAHSSLRSLDLSMGSLTERGARTLANAVGTIGLDVRESRLSEVGQAELVDASANVVIGVQDMPDDEGSILEERGWGALRRRRSEGHAAWKALDYGRALPQFESQLRIARAIGDALELSALRSLGGITYNLDRLDESIEYRRQVLERNPESIDALEALATSYRTRGRNHHAEELLEQAVELSVGEPANTHRLHVELAAIRVGVGREKEALDGCRAAAAFEDESGTPRARTFNILGGVEQRSNNYKAAATAYRRALELEDNDHNRLPIELNLAQLDWILGDREKAAERYRHGAALAKKLGIKRDHGSALAGLGHLYANWGRYKLAEAALREAIPILEAAQSQLRLGEAYGHLGNVLLAKRDDQGAEAAFLRSFEVAKQTGHLQGQSESLCHLAGVYIDRGDLEACERACQQALEAQRSRGDRWGESTSLCQLGEAQLARGDDAAATASFERAAELAVAVGNPRWRAWNESELGRVCFARGESESTRQYYETALATLAKIADESMLGRLKGHLAALEFSLGSKTEACDWLEKARAHLEKAGDKLGSAMVDDVDALIHGRPMSDSLYAAWLRRAMTAIVGAVTGESS